MITRQSGTEWSKSCHMVHVPSLLPACHSLRTQSGSRRALTSPARFTRTSLIGLSLRFQIAIAGNQSSGDTSMDIFSTCAAKHLAFVTYHDSPEALPAATISASSFFSPGTSSPVALSVTS